MSLVPLTIVVLSIFMLKLYLVLADPVLHASDPWFWAQIVESYSRGLTIEQLYTPLLGGWGFLVYPKGYPLLATLIALATGTSGYEVVRFSPVISVLNLIPMYFLSYLISKSQRIAAVSIIFVSISKWYAIRTSIGNPEGFTHFWLVLSLLFLLRLREKGTWRNVAPCVFFIVATLMFWHLPIAIYVVFLPILACVNLRHRAYFRRLVLVAALSAIVAGALWYFWARPSGWVSLARWVTTQDTSSGLESPVESWGYVLLFLGIVGFVYVFRRLASRRDPSEVFLAAYFMSILGLILVFLGVGWAIGVYYSFPSLALPLSIFAAIGLVAGIDAVTPALERWTATSSRPFSSMKGRWRRILALLVIIIVLLANSNPANYAGDTAYSVSFHDLIIGGRQTGVDDQGSRWIATFQYGKAFDAPSDDLYSALKWIRDHSSEQSCASAFLIPPSPSLPSSVLHRAFGAISERSLIEATEFGSLLLDSPTMFLDKISSSCIGDVYVVTGIYSWLGEEWANSSLESKFLSLATQVPVLLPEVYFLGKVRVFCITQKAALPAADSPYQASYGPHRTILFTNEATWRLVSVT